MSARTQLPAFLDPERIDPATRPDAVRTALDPSRAPTRRHPYPALPPKLGPGAVLDGFQVVQELASAGTSTVYRALDQHGGRDVALKVLSPHLAIVPAAVSRFRAEFVLTWRAAGPGVVPVYRCCRWGDHHLYSMALAEGGAIQAIPLRLRTAAADVFRAVAARFVPVVRALARLHQAGIVHRDVKPDNILLGPGGDLLLSDFGSAVDVAAGVGDPDTGLWGTIRYLSPDQFLSSADSRDPRIDIYALGLTIFEVATGASLFPRCAAAELVRHKLSRRPPDPRRVAPEIPMALDTILRRAMEPDPRSRYPTAAELARALDRFAGR